MKLERKSEVPIYIQVKNYIMEDIKNGRLKLGEKLPTERELCEKLKVSRNTVSAAYNLLEQEGVLVSYQGKGTFVAEEAKTWKQHSIKDKVFRIIDLAFKQAIEMGFNTKEFLALVQERVKENEALIKNANAIFVECNVEQARYFAEQLSRMTDLNIVPMTLHQLKDRDELNEKIIHGAQIIITAFNHVNEVKALTMDLRKEVFGVATNPSLETIVKMAQYPKGTQIGQISISKEFNFKIQYALKAARLENFHVIATTSKDEKEIRKVIDACDLIIVSPGREEEIKRLVEGQKEVMRFDYVLDEGSVKEIISRIMEIKRHL